MLIVLQSGGAGAVNTALFIQNTVQLRSLMTMTCKDENDVDQDYKTCFLVSQKILYVLIILSMGFQLIYGFFMIVGMYYITVNTQSSGKFESVVHNYVASKSN